MKLYLTSLMTILIAGSLWAAPPKATVKGNPVTSPSVTTNLPPAVIGHARSVITLAPPKPNQIQGERYVYGGVAVQMVKTRHHPWQWLNPAVPVAYGYGDYNLDRDIITGRPVGFRLFSIGF